MTYLITSFLHPLSLHSQFSHTHKCVVVFTLHKGSQKLIVQKSPEKYRCGKTSFRRKLVVKLVVQPMTTSAKSQEVIISLHFQFIC